MASAWTVTVTASLTSANRIRIRMATVTDANRNEIDSMDLSFPKILSGVNSCDKNHDQSMQNVNQSGS